MLVVSQIDYKRGPFSVYMIYEFELKSIVNIFELFAKNYLNHNHY